MDTRQLQEPRGRGEAGFTLIEALIAMIVLVVGLVGISNLFLVAGGSNKIANRGTAAANIASEQMDDLKTMSFPALAARAGGDLDNDQANYFRNDNINGVGRFHTTWMITTVNSHTLFVQVRSQGVGPLGGQLTRAEFTTFRSCPTPGQNGC